MEWINNMNDAIDYIEHHITDEIDYNIIAQKASCSVYNFQRLFSFILNMPLSEYIRYRRLTLAAIEIQNSNAKIVDLAVKYGYDSHEAFSRAFQKFHGITPSAARKKDVVLKYCSKASFKIIISGGIKMQDYVTGKNSHVIQPEFSIKQAHLEQFEGARCPEMQPLTGSIRACLDYMGENYGFADNKGTRLDKGTVYIYNLVGEAYTHDPTRMYDTNNLKNSLDGIKRLFHNLDYKIEICTTDPERADYLPFDLMKERIKNHLFIKKRPVVTDGVWAVPMNYAVVGYTDGGDTLVGWNYHVFNNNPNPDPFVEKKSNWYDDATFVIFIGEQTKRVDDKELYKRIIREAYYYLTDGKSVNLYRELIRLLNKSEDECIAEARRRQEFLGEGVGISATDDEMGAGIICRMLDPIWCCVAERRFYAAHFFKLAQEVFPEYGELLGKIEASFWIQSGKFGEEYLKEVGHDPVDRDKFRDMAVRRRMAEVVESARQEEEKTIKLIEELIDCMEV